MPAPVKIDGRKVWDIRHLDLAFDTRFQGKMSHPIRGMGYEP
jgi:hypothetical protein